MTETIATLETGQAQFSEMIRQTALDFHENLYLNITDGRLRLLGGASGGTVVVYSDYVEGDIESIEAEEEAHAIIDVETLEDYLPLFDDMPIKVEFISSNEDRRAEQLQISAGHTTEVGIALPASEEAYGSVPRQLPGMFDADNVLLNPSEERQVETTISTFTEELAKIVRIVDLREELEYYPISVENGQFTLDVGSAGSNYVNWELEGSVSGEDVSNLYGDGLPSVVKAVSGEVKLHLEQDKPMAIIKEGSYNTIRHVLGNAK